MLLKWSQTQIDLQWSCFSHKNNNLKMHGFERISWLIALKLKTISKMNVSKLKINVIVKPKVKNETMLRLKGIYFEYFFQACSCSTDISFGINCKENAAKHASSSLTNVAQTTISKKLNNNSKLAIVKTLAQEEFQLPTCLKISGKLRPEVELETNKLWA